MAGKKLTPEEEFVSLLDTAPTLTDIVNSETMKRKLNPNIGLDRATPKSNAMANAVEDAINKLYSDAKLSEEFFVVTKDENGNEVRQLRSDKERKLMEFLASRAMAKYVPTGSDDPNVAKAVQSALEKTASSYVIEMFGGQQGYAQVLGAIRTSSTADTAIAQAKRYINEGAINYVSGKHASLFSQAWERFGPDDKVGGMKTFAKAYSVGLPPLLAKNVDYTKFDAENMYRSLGEIGSDVAGKLPYVMRRKPNTAAGNHI